MMKNKYYIDFAKIFISVFFALLLWYYVVSEQNPIVTRSYDIPIKVLNSEYIDKNDLMLMNNINNLNVIVKFKGNQDDLNQIKTSDISAKADLQGVKVKGVTEANIIISGYPAKVELVEQSEKSIKLTLDNKINLNMKVIYRTKGKTQEGYAPIINKISPAEISITGAESIVRTATKAEVIIDISQISGETDKELPVIIYNDEGKEISELNISPKAVRVSMSLGPVKLVNVMPQIMGKVPEGYVLIENTAYPRYISLTGKTSALEGLTEIKTEKIDIKNINGRVERIVRLILPPDVYLSDQEAIVKVLINVEKIITKDFKTTLEIRNLKEGYLVDVPPQEVVFKITGADSIVNNSETVVKGYIDMTGVIEGDFRMKVRWEIPKDYQIISVTPDTVDVRIKKN